MKQDPRSLLRQAQEVASLNQALIILRDARSVAQSLLRRNASADNYSLLAAIDAEFAASALTPQERSNHWQSAMTAARQGWRTTKDSSCAEALALIIVDYVEDGLSLAAPSQRRKALAEGISTLDDTLRLQAKPPIRATLLARKAALLRFQAQGLSTLELQKRRAEEALRCAEAARGASEEGGEPTLQHGLALWYLSRFARSDREFTQLLQRSDESIWLSIDKGNAISGLITLSRFYRLTYQGPQSCQTFERYAEVEDQRRRLWRNSHVYGEAAIQVWYSDFPSDYSKSHLVASEKLLTEALDAGVTTARNIVDLAFLRAVLLDVRSGEAVLADLYPGSEGVDWQRAMEVAEQATSETSDLVGRGFALGIDDGSVWNKLGTFTNDFLDKPRLAMRFYQQALRINPHDPVALTNLARVLILEGEGGEADRLLQRAASHSNRRFHWWRAVRSMLPQHEVRKSLGSAANKVPQHASSINELRRWFSALEQMEDHQRRGYELERLLAELFQLTLGNSQAAYRTLSHQIDGAIYLDTHAYRCEARWRKKMASKNDIAVLALKLDVAGVTGLFISMSGFDDSAVETARQYSHEKRILLMDGDELKLVIDGLISFDAVLSRKRAFLDFRSNPYARVDLGSSRALG